MDKILEAGRVVPTACNYQPQHFYVIRQPIVRNGRQATVGYAPDVWKTWQ